MTKTTIFPFQGRSSFKLIFFILLLSLPLLLYYGYCWGWWGRQSLLLQYLFQCSCPIVSEEARYPDEVDVIVSACRNAGIRLSPSGRLLYVRERQDDLTSTYLLDLQTYKKVSFVLPEGSNYFLTDDLVFLSLDYGGGEYILDRTTGKQYPIQRFIHVQPSAYSYGKLDQNILFEDLLQVERVFFIDTPYQLVIVLSSDFQTDSEHSFTFEASALSGDYKTLLRQFLQQNNIAYYEVPSNFPDETISPDGRFVARPDGIYLVETEKKIVEVYSASKFYRPYSRKYFLVRGWTSDGTGVIYSKFLDPCLIEYPGLDAPGCIIEVPQPVIKLKIPEEYLLPAQRP
ncbi:MAG TPA: hypothetical protein VFQ13_13660 [Anaerolineales bacterium]|nr:hypothetical protein [Anaerolineales bacterium]